MEKNQKNAISAELAGTLDGLFRERVQRTPDAIAYTVFNRKQKEWQPFTWQQMANRVSQWQSALNKTGVKSGDRVAICLKNSPEWVCADQAALGLGLVVVPLYIEDRPDNVAYVIQDAGVTVLFVQTSKQWECLLEASADALQGVKHVIFDFVCNDI